MSDPARETGTLLDVKYDANGLVPAIVQDHESGEILMMGWMNEGALKQTLETKLASFYSRSRQKFWIKGESSGNTQEVVEARIDCDQDTIILKVKSNGPCCHVGYNSCFYRKITGPESLETVDEKAYDPSEVYK
ncbi:phosphoribosyl-AMP cyclohydrolase [Algisphaera agarilytica]|uniref:Phosphoribosyl-AMP cyclohydrolase n=1 Tax=Algisphaera agarilytica TaxID=1385975 RepID=A0A7X0H893_9BACT|nr:phosphoribosyl-AMP cyclohydrolase [Algisphaera agarilytica]MBB6431089.1 phosphoribosyl-AMP cyclohydrolase [Algisphaera agarilytica]